MYISLQTITKLIGLSTYFQKETILNKLNKRPKKMTRTRRPKLYRKWLLNKEVVLVNYFYLRQFRSWQLTFYLRSIQWDHTANLKRRTYSFHPRTERSIVFQEDILALTSISEQMLYRKMITKLRTSCLSSQKEGYNFVFFRKSSLNQTFTVK